jgi:hypothetical protein
MPAKKNKAGYVDKIVENEMIAGIKPGDIKAKIDQLELDAEEIVSDIRKAKGKIRQIQSNYTLQLQVDEENRLKKIEYENLQRQQNEQLLNDFNRLNKGRTQLARQQDESEDDFYLRLVAMGNVEADPSAIEKQIQTDILIKAKKNMLELTNDLSKAETAIKLLTNDERFQMNKVFPKIKKNYSETFGLNNKDMDANEISDFIQNELTTGQSIGSSDDVMITKLKKLGKKRLYFLVDALNDADPSLNLFKGSVEDTINDIDRKDIYKTDMFIDNYNYVSKMDPNFTIARTAAVKTRGLAEEAEKKEAIDRFNREQAAAAAAAVPADDEEEAIPADDEEEAITFGGGLKNQVLPQTVIFGKIALDLNKLYYQNVLSIKRHNGNKIIGHKNRRVSDNFVDIIFKMFNNKAITQSDLKNIKDELQIYDNLVVQSGLHKSNLIPTTIEQTSEQMKKRLGLLTGEIEAGNSNKSLLTELHELLFKMVRIHLISKSAATKYYNNLKDQFFTI